MNQMNQDHTPRYGMFLHADGGTRVIPSDPLGGYKPIGMDGTIQDELDVLQKTIDEAARLITQLRSRLERVSVASPIQSARTPSEPRASPRTALAAEIRQQSDKVSDLSFQIAEALRALDI